MKKILAFLGLCLMLGCQQPSVDPNSFHVTFLNERGATIKEAFSSLVVRMKAAEIGNLNPRGISPNDVQLKLDGVPAQIVATGTDYIDFVMPVMYLADYKSLRISLIYQQLRFRILDQLLYRPTVTAQVLAGRGEAGPDGSFEMPAEMTLDASGNLYVIDQRTGHDVVLKVTPTGTVSSFAGDAGEFGRLTGLGINPAGTLMYVADATAQQLKAISMTAPSTVTVLAGSGTAGNANGTGTAASFSFGQERVDNFSTNERGQGLTLDASGNIYVGERVGTSPGYNGEIRKITPAGVVTTVPNSAIVAMGMSDLATPAGLTLSPTGEPVYVCGNSTLYQGMVQIPPPPAAPIRLAGAVSTETLNDGTGSVARFSFPKAVQYAGGFYFVADGTNGALRRADTDGTVITLAGVGHFNTPTWCGCGTFYPRDTTYVLPAFFSTSADKYEIAAKAVKMDQVGGVAAKSAGLIYVSDYGTNFKCIWKIRVE